MFIPVVLGSVREGRNSIFPARFVLEKIKALGHETELVDFKELPLPFFDSPLVPVALKGVYPHPNVQKWSDIARRADAFVLIVSEYNHSYTAVLKNALDWLYMEFEKKPFGLAGVSDGSFGGIRAIEHMRPVIENFSGFAIRETLNFFKSPLMFDQAGNLIDETYQGRVDRFLKPLVWSAEVMKLAKEKK